MVGKITSFLVREKGRRKTAKTFQKRLTDPRKWMMTLVKFNEDHFGTSDPITQLIYNRKWPRIIVFSFSGSLFALNDLGKCKESELARGNLEKTLCYLQLFLQKDFIKKRKRNVCGFSWYQIQWQARKRTPRVVSHQKSHSRGRIFSLAVGLFMNLLIEWSKKFQSCWWLYVDEYLKLFSPGDCKRISRQRHFAMSQKKNQFAGTVSESIPRKLCLRSCNDCFVMKK